jgi:multimeric flavodoxin WrbA
MKILGLSCSPRIQGNTALLINEVLKAAQQEGADVELYSVSGKKIEPCDGCRICWETGECPINDEMQNLYGKLLEANGIIFGTPVYFYSMTGQAKTIIDRTIALNKPGRNLANKVGGIVVVGGSLGLVDAVKDLYFYIVTRQMLPANFVAAYAGGAGDVKNMEKCINAAGELGRQMVQMIDKKFEYPSDIRRSSIAYGTHTR